MPDELSQADIDSLLSGGSFSGGEDLSSNDIDALLGGMEESRMGLPDFSATAASDNRNEGELRSIELLYDVDLNVRVELGRTRLPIEDVLRLRDGSVVKFDKDAGAQVDIMVNDRLVGHGEVLVLNDLFCIRVTEVLSEKDRSLLCSL